MKSNLEMSSSQISAQCSCSATDKSFQKKTAPRKLKYRHKHPPNLHAWAGISKRGTTMFQGIMTATRYGDILTASFIPFVHKAKADGYRLYQDNDPKHTSWYIQAFLPGTASLCGRALPKVRIRTVLKKYGDL